MSMDLVSMMFGIPSGPGALKGLRRRAAALIRRLLISLIPGRGVG